MFKTNADKLPCDYCKVLYQLVIQQQKLIVAIIERTQYSESIKETLFPGIEK